MFKQRFFYSLFFLLFLFILNACKSDKQDTSKPFINIVNPASSEVLYVYSDEEFLTELYFKDNKELSQFRVLVKSDFETPIQPDANNSLANAFKMVYVKNLKGEEAKETLVINVDKQSASGNYTLIIDAVDASGNQAEPVSLNFIVKSKADSLGPKIYVITPVESAQFPKDTTIMLSLLFEDFRSDNSEGFIYDFNVKIFKDSDTTEVFSTSQTINKKSPQSFNQNLPLISEPGEYKIKISARDDFNNMSEFTRVFRVL